MTIIESELKSVTENFQLQNFRIEIVQPNQFDDYFHRDTEFDPRLFLATLNKRLL